MKNFFLSIWLFSSFLFLFFINVSCDQVQRSNPEMHSTLLTLNSTTLTGKYNVIYSVDQMWPSGSQMIFNTEILDVDFDPVIWYVSAQNKKTKNVTTIYTYSQDDQYKVDSFSPPANNPAIYPDFDFTVILAAGQDNNSTDTFTTGSTQIIFTQLWLDGSSYWKNAHNPTCPGYIYYYVESPKDQSYAYNLTLEGQYWTVMFSDLWIRNGKWPTNDTYDFYFNDFNQFESIQTTIAADTIFTERWYLIFKCKTTKALTNPYWQIGAYLDPTCKKSCFDTGGTCFSNAPIPYCTCSRWYRDGEATCTSLFEGDYTLIILALILTIGLFIYICRKIYRCCLSHNRPEQKEFYLNSTIQDEESPRVEKQPLLQDNF